MDIKINVNVTGLDDLDQTFAEEARGILTEAAAAAVNHLRELDLTPDVSGHTHPELAELWDHTGVQEDPNGWSVEVFSHAEEMTFYNYTTGADGERVKSMAYAVPGKMLLTILEAGAQAHFIFPKNAQRLAIPNPGSAERSSDFERRYGFYYKVPRSSVETFYATEVMHPGVVGDEHVQETYEWAQQMVESWGEEAAERIAVRVNRPDTVK